MVLKEDKFLREKYYREILESGFIITYIPKDIPINFAFLSVDFGGNDCKYIKNGVITELPYGIAHFLEHKMFERPDGRDAFSEFDIFGGSANAFTSTEATAYYFSADKNFFENLDILLSTVTRLDITNASVEREKNIIAREIMMYEDSPTARLSKNLSSALYFNHPLIHPISGEISDIEKITPADLKQAFSDFYIPSNMSLTVCGNVDIERVLSECKRYFPKCDKARPETVFGIEPEKINKEVVTEEGIIANNLFSLGFKCIPEPRNDYLSQRKATAMRIAITLLFGRASDFYCSAYESGIVNDRFDCGYNSSKNSANIIITGSANDPYRLRCEIIREIEYRKINFFSEEKILREKKACFAESITIFDLGEDIAAAMAANPRADYDEFDAINLIRDITGEEIKSALDSIDTSKLSLSIITPKGDF